MLARLGKPITLPPPTADPSEQDAQDTKLGWMHGLTRTLANRFQHFCCHTGHVYI